MSKQKNKNPTTETSEFITNSTDERNTDNDSANSYSENETDSKSPDSKRDKK